MAHLLFSKQEDLSSDSQSFQKKHVCHQDYVVAYFYNSSTGRMRWRLADVMAPQATSLPEKRKVQFNGRVCAKK